MEKYWRNSRVHVNNRKTVSDLKRLFCFCIYGFGEKCFKNFNMKIYVIILGFLANLFSICLLAFYFHSGAILGYLPSYNQPDPKRISIYSFYSPLISITGNIALFALPISIILILIYVIIEGRSISWRTVVFNLISFSIAILLFLSGIMEWYAD